MHSIIRSRTDKREIIFLVISVNASLEHIRVLRSSKGAGWAGLASMWRTYLKHVEEYLKLYNRALAAATLARR